jgi:hypothetical protein
MKTRRHPVEIPGRDSGNVTVQNVVHVLAPRSALASMSL